MAQFNAIVLAGSRGTRGCEFEYRKEREFLTILNRVENIPESYGRLLFNLIYKNLPRSISISFDEERFHKSIH